MRRTGKLWGLLVICGAVLLATALRLVSEPGSAAKPEPATTFTLAINSFAHSFRCGEAIPLTIAVGNAGETPVYVPNAYNGFVVRVWEVHLQAPAACMSIPFEPCKSRQEVEEKAGAAAKTADAGPALSTDVATEVPARGGMAWYCPNILHVAGPITSAQPLKAGRYRIQIDRVVDAFTKAQTRWDGKAGVTWVEMSKKHEIIHLTSNVIEVQVSATKASTCPNDLPLVTRVPELE